MSSYEDLLRRYEDDGRPGAPTQAKSGGCRWHRMAAKLRRARDRGRRLSLGVRKDEGLYTPRVPLLGVCPGCGVGTQRPRERCWRCASGAVRRDSAMAEAPRTAPILCASCAEPLWVPEWATNLVPYKGRLEIVCERCRAALEGKRRAEYVLRRNRY